ncbi:MAG: hypothetical protein ACRDPA_14220 [Solirubrobacteraceae bacterium]
MRARVLCLAIAIVIGVVAPALARGTSEKGAVLAEYRKAALLEYFGPPTKLCAQFTSADRRAFSKFFIRPMTCERTARKMMHLLRNCKSSDGFSPSQWRNGVRESLALVKVRILSSHAARVTDPLYEHEALVRHGHAWVFSRGWPPVER